MKIVKPSTMLISPKIFVGVMIVIWVVFLAVAMGTGEDTHQEIVVSNIWMAALWIIMHAEEGRNAQ